MEKVGECVLDPETEFLASKQETGHEWELFKENVRPLKRGRNVQLLNNALKSNTDFQLKKSLLDKRRFYPFPFPTFEFEFSVLILICLVICMSKLSGMDIDSSYIPTDPAWFWFRCSSSSCYCCIFKVPLLIYELNSFCWGMIRALIEAIDQYKGEDPLQPWLQWVLFFWNKIDSFLKHFSYPFLHLNIFWTV